MDKTTQLPSKANTDPGWNDPPIFSYENVQTKPRKSNLLNKRVAFPLSSQPSTPAATENASPLIPKCSPVLLPNPQPTRALPHDNSVHDVVNAEVNDMYSVKSVRDNFEKCMERFPDSATKDLVEIRKRLDIMETMWKEEKLIPDVCQKICDLSSVLKEGKYTDADHIHKCLMVDHVNMCSPWMAGIRKLIHLVQDSSET